MKTPDETVAPETRAKPGAVPPKPTGQLRPFAIAAILLTLCYSLPLYDLVRFALGSDLNSHILLVPFISGYLIWLRRNTLPSRWATDSAVAVTPLILGVLALAGYWSTVLIGLKLPREDRFALTVASYLFLLIGLGGWCFGREMLRAILFPLAFLIFTLPMPVFLVNGLENFLQHGSAEVAFALYSLAGTPTFRQELVFQLPGITLQVAPECSGLHSTLALFITSLLAGHLFLSSWTKRTILTIAVIPLALLRNGFRVFVIGELCVHISPDMINSYIHHHGGPIFFALSLVPFGFFLLYLRRSERTVSKPMTQLRAES